MIYNHDCPNCGAIMNGGEVCPECELALRAASAKLAAVERRLSRWQRIAGIHTRMKCEREIHHAIQICADELESALATTTKGGEA